MYLKKMIQMECLAILVLFRSKEKLLMGMRSQKRIKGTEKAKKI